MSLWVEEKSENLYGWVEAFGWEKKEDQEKRNKEKGEDLDFKTFGGAEQ